MVLKKISVTLFFIICSGLIAQENNSKQATESSNNKNIKPTVRQAPKTNLKTGTKPTPAPPLFNRSENKFHMGLLSFQSKAKINSPSGESYDMLSTTFATSLNYSNDFHADDFIFSLNGFLFAGTSNIQASVPSFIYPNTKTATMGAGFDLKYLVKLSSESKYLLGPELGTFVKYTKWLNANSGSGLWKITPSIQIFPTLGLAGQYLLDEWFFIHRVGLSTSMSSIYWNIGIGKIF